MAKRIPKTFIDELIARVDIVEVIDRRLPLKKAGKEFIACCPFHGEKTPSFKVNPVKQFYHCFGCGAHGSAIGFLMEFEQLDFVSAIETLAAHAGCEVPTENQEGVPQTPTQQPLYEILEQAAAYFQTALRTHPLANTAVAYLQNRGVSGEIAKQFGLGFAPPGWNNLLDQFPSPENQRALLEAGLTIKKDSGGFYDRFRNRIMFPICDKRGRVIGFGGRVLDPSDSPKYLNSPETPLFHKGRELYGWLEARRQGRDLKRFLVVEGYMDVMALAQHGITYAVATLGTATTDSHLETLYRGVPEVVFCFDGDAAGLKAATRALETTLAHLRDGRSAGFVFLPEGEDPDSLVRREGKEAFEQRIANALPLSEFLISRVSSESKMNSLDGRAQFVTRSKTYIQKIPEGVFRNTLTQKIADLALVPTHQVAVKTEPPTTATHHLPKPRGRSPIRTALTLVFHHPSFAEKVGLPEMLKGNAQTGAELLYRVLEILKTSPHLSSAALLERWHGQAEYVHLAQLLTSDPGEDVDELQTQFVEIIAHLVKQISEARWAFLQQKLLHKGLSSDEKQEYQQLLVRQTTPS